MGASFKNYHKPTPVLYRKIGDAVLILGTTLTTTFAGMELDKGWIIAAAIITALGKMITNMFTDEDSIDHTIEYNQPENEQKTN